MDDKNKPEQTPENKLLRPANKAPVKPPLKRGPKKAPAKEVKPHGDDRRGE